MSIKNTLSITEARKKLFDIIKEVQKPANYYTLTDKGRPKVVLISADEYESWVETLAAIEEFPDLDKDIAETERAFKSGAYKKWPTLEDLGRKWGIAQVADKPIKKYVVHFKNKTKSPKSHR